MARYTGPVCRLCRHHGMKLFLKGARCFGPKCAIERRRSVPGVHGQSRRKVTEYGVQLAEKQKIRSIYGVLEAQFRKHFAEALRRPGSTGANLLSILESRLDNVVYRLGFADSRNQARQIVRHGHFVLNGRKTNVPSALLREGDVVEVRGTSKGLEYFEILKASIGTKSVPRWLAIEPEGLRGRISTLPAREEIDTVVNEQLVVEFYSR
ncbi:MAG: 30S ribosomal protein S4 [Chloroflexi bacterium]|nr:30S ribosomal protein S4 [Chloroflexota bacterium]